MTVQGVLYIFNWGLLKIILMDRFHFSEQFGGVVLGVGCLLVVLILYLMQRYAERFHEKRILTVLSMLVAGSLLVSVPDIGLFGIVVIFILYAGDGVFYPFLSDVLNKHAPNNQRATILSVASFLKVLPYVILAPLIGLLNMQGKLHWFLIGWTALIMMAWAYYIVSKRRDEVILVQESYQ
jgi:predicted MFS family arabinose efflux permease